MKRLFIITLLLATIQLLNAAEKRPNIVFAIADDWGWPHAGAYGDKSLQTPVFDELAKEGILFDHAYVSSPSCTPSRGAILSGQHHWRLREGANLWGTLSKKIPLYTDLLRENGYLVGSMKKGWGPGNYKSGGRKIEPAGKNYENFEAFLEERKEGQPFCFWFGSHDPHRPYEPDIGGKSGIDIKSIKLYGCLPDHPTVRKDVADYLYEVNRFDREVGSLIARLKEIGEYENTIIVMTGDHGMPFPRCKGNLYDTGTRVPLAVTWKKGISNPFKFSKFVSLTDLAPTFLEAAGVEIPDQMTGQSLMEIFSSDKKWVAEKNNRDFIVFGRERHTLAQKYPSKEGYPCRGIRTEKYLLIKNFKPSLWPAGVPNNSTRGVQFSDCDFGPAKQFIIKNRDDANVLKYFDLCFNKRPKFELYDLAKDPEQLKNVADEEKYEDIKQELWGKLKNVLKESADPRVSGDKCKFSTYEYFGRKRNSK